MTERSPSKCFRVQAGFRARVGTRWHGFGEVDQLTEGQSVEIALVHVLGIDPHVATHAFGDLDPDRPPLGLARVPPT